MKKNVIVLSLLLAIAASLCAQNKPIVTDIQAVAAKGTRINIYFKHHLCLEH